MAESLPSKRSQKKILQRFQAALICVLRVWETISSTDVLIDALIEDAEDPSSNHDFENIIPKLLSEGHPIYAYDFGQNTIPGEPGGRRPTGEMWGLSIVILMQIWMSDLFFLH